MSESVKYGRSWDMPNSNTFDIPSVRRFISRYYKPGIKSVDPFANKSKLATITNDLMPEHGTDYNMDAKDFLRLMPDADFDLCFFDPPYSPRQVSEVYTSCGLSVNMETTQSSFWSEIKRELARIVKPGGIVLTFGWNSNGIGKQYGFEIIEVHNVAHGGWHNDTICVAERKKKDLFSI